MKHPRLTADEADAIKAAMFDEWKAAQTPETQLYLADYIDRLIDIKGMGQQSAKVLLVEIIMFVQRLPEVKYE